MGRLSRSRSRVFVARDDPALYYCWRLLQQKVRKTVGHQKVSIPSVCTNTQFWWSTVVLYLLSRVLIQSLLLLQGVTRIFELAELPLSITGDVTCMVTGGLSKFVAQCTVLNGYDSLKFTELCISITEYRFSCNFVSSQGAKGDSGRCISRFFAHKSYRIQ